MIAILALMVALGGTAVAAKLGGSQIKRNAIKAKHIKDGNVTVPKLANGNVTRAQAGVRRQELREGERPGFLTSREAL